MKRSDQHTADARIAVEHAGNKRATDEKLVAEQPWLQQTVTELRQPVAPSVAGQLRAARRIALTPEKSERSWLRGMSLPAWGGTALAGLGAITVSIMLFMQPDHSEGITTRAVQTAVNGGVTESGDQAAVQTAVNDGAVNGNALLEDLSIIAAQDELQFYQDLELLQWLAEEAEFEAQG